MAEHLHAPLVFTRGTGAAWLLERSRPGGSRVLEPLVREVWVGVGVKESTAAAVWSVPPLAWGWEGVLLAVAFPAVLPSHSPGGASGLCTEGTQALGTQARGSERLLRADAVLGSAG